MPIIQEAIHKLEVAGGMKYLRWGLAGLAVVAAIVFYNLRSYRNMATQEAMDMAQVARNISQGKGYTTYFIRPFSMFLLRRHNEQGPTPLFRCAECGKVFEAARPRNCPNCKASNVRPEPLRLKDLTKIDFEVTGHPDISNPPVYPLV